MTQGRPFARLLRAAQGRAPDDVLTTLADGAALLGATGIALLLVDYEQQVLQPTDPAEPGSSVAGTMAGRCFTTQTVLDAENDDGLHVWVPVSERAERLGVLTITLPSGTSYDPELAEELGLLAALLIGAAAAYTDRFALQRRRRDLGLPAEMQWSLLPPLSFSAAGTTVAGLLEPAYDVGGDCFDYALNGDLLHVAVFDAMGHGLPSSVLSGLAVGAYRHARRSGTALPDLLGAMDAAVAGLVGDTFVTALVGELDIRTGRLAWLTAGHPPPIVVRDGGVLPEPLQVPALPVGLGLAGRETAPPSELALQPGDRVLLYTDGVVEARSPEGEEFGIRRLLDFFVRESGSGLLPSEVLRRLVRICLDFQGGVLRDDATLLLVEWGGPPD